MGISLRSSVLTVVAGSLTVAGSVSIAAGQTSAAPTSPSAASGATVESGSIRPERSALQKMSRRMTLKADKTRLEDVLKFIQEFTKAEIDVYWTTDQVQGLEKDREITLNISNQPALYVLEQVLDRAKNGFSENTWQMSSSGQIEVGPKDILNKSKRLEIYDINDLLFVLPRYDDVPQIDLNNVLQQSQGGGGGGGQSPFTNVNTTNNLNLPTKEQRAREIIDLITQTVETTQWVDNGGEGGSVRYFNGTLLINAPDYMHRQINGYPYWPSTTSKKLADGRRYVTLNMDTGLGKVDRITNVPQTAAVPGQPAPAQTPPGPGGP